jgi:hypothetical protein
MDKLLESIGRSLREISNRPIRHCDILAARWQQGFGWRLGREPGVFEPPPIYEYMAPRIP